LDIDVVDTVDIDLAAIGVTVGSSRGSSSAMKAEASSSWNSSEARTDGEGWGEEEEGGATPWRDLSWLNKETCIMQVKKTTRCWHSLHPPANRPALPSHSLFFSLRGR
jgi:hypothetical protein